MRFKHNYYICWGISTDYIQSLLRIGIGLCQLYVLDTLSVPYGILSRVHAVLFSLPRATWINVRLDLQYGEVR